MSKAYFIPNDDKGKRSWLNNFAAKLPAYATVVGVTPAEVTAVQADSACFTYVCDARSLCDQSTRRWTSYKNALRNGGSLGPVPSAVTLPAAPAAVAADIFGRNSTLAARIKKHPGYAEAIGRDLGIIGAEHADIDLTTIKPVIQISLQAAHPNVAWSKQGMDGLEIHVDRDGKGFTFLAIDTVPDYLDTAPLPAPSAGAVWKYKAIYRLNDEQVGQWSDIAAIAVGVT